MESNTNPELQSIWYEPDNDCVKIIDQRTLPHKLEIEEICSLNDMCRAVRDMHVRGAPLIGVAAGYGMYLACREAEKSGAGIETIYKAGRLLKETRPTAVNCTWAVEKQLSALKSSTSLAEASACALKTAKEIETEEIECSGKIGEYGLKIIEKLYKRNRDTIRILTHCNAGWLACVRYGTATAPMYAAFEQGIPLHIWVDETRPRNQGARLTAWELGRKGIPHTVIADNTGGHLMQHGQVDLVLVGSDRTTRAGDTANKIGTYLKALAAKDNGIPFYVALPCSSIDMSIRDGLTEIPIERRDGEEVRTAQGLLKGRIEKVLITPESSPAVNYAFDVTPARLITGFITERGVCPATEDGIRKLFT